VWPCLGLLEVLHLVDDDTRVGVLWQAYDALVLALMHWLFCAVRAGLRRLTRRAPLAVRQDDAAAMALGRALADAPWAKDS
jgi:hypothetical protein